MNCWPFYRLYSDDPELLDAAWTRVDSGPVERERRRGPFSVESVAGMLALAAVDLIVLQREADRAELYLGSDDVGETRWATARAVGR